MSAAMRRLPAVALLLVAWPSIGHAQDADTYASVIETILVGIEYGAAAGHPSNLNSGPFNQYVGVQQQGSDCNASTGYASTVIGGFGPCFPGNNGQANAGLQMLNNLTPGECISKSFQGGTALSGTVMPGTEGTATPVFPSDIQEFGPVGSSGPLSGLGFNPNVGGTCGPNPSFTKPGVTFEGYIAGQFVIKGIQTVAPENCAILLNWCSQGTCTCGLLKVGP